MRRCCLQSGGLRLTTLAIAMCRRLLHLAKDERAYIASERFLVRAEELVCFPWR